MVIVMIPLAEPENADPKIVSAMIGCIEAAITELAHVADRVDRPGHIINHQHRHIEAPKHSGQTKGEIQGQRQSKMRQDIEQGVLPEAAVPNFTYIGRVTLRTLTEFS